MPVSVLENLLVDLKMISDNKLLLNDLKGLIFIQKIILHLITNAFWPICRFCHKRIFSVDR